MSIVKALSAIQSGLKAPKDQKANRYRYRNIEDINEAVKPLAAAQGCAVVYTDQMEFTEGYVTCVSTCTLTGEQGSMSASGFAIVNVDNKNMSIEQSCGSASSYARKYAACGLFAIDDSADDPDRVNAAPKPAASKPADKLALLRALYGEALAVGISKDGIEGWRIATIKKEVSDMTPQEVKAFEEYLAGMIRDKKSLDAA
ncbi:MAG: ERF family protein [Eggerthellaceae bacterium]|nr:ERF family protein [Eggerthellaceae bacterium]